jgi:hypothetical protein
MTLVSKNRDENPVKMRLSPVSQPNKERASTPKRSVKKLPNIPIQKWRRTTPRRIEARKVTAPPLYYEVASIMLSCRKTSPPPSLATEMAPLYRLKPLKRDAVPRHPSFLTLREKCNSVFETMLNYASQGVKWAVAA